MFLPKQGVQEGRPARLSGQMNCAPLFVPAAFGSSPAPSEQALGAGRAPA